MELISVIVLTYNSEKTVLETLDSIRKQTYPNIEIIVSDDCSSDCTVEVVTRWFSNTKFKGKIITSEHNKGIPFNYNKGIRAASGELIKGIAGDDILFPNSILTFYNSYKKDKNCIWVSRCHCFGNDLSSVNKIQKYFGNYSFYYLSNKEQYEALCIKNRITAPSIGLINKHLFEKYGYFDEHYPLIEDYPFNLKMSKNGILFKLIDEELVNYRVYNSSVSNKPSLQFFKCEQQLFFKERLWKMFVSFHWGSLIKQFFKYFLVFFHYSVSSSDGHIVLHRLE